MLIDVKDDRDPGHAPASSGRNLAGPTSAKGRFDRGHQFARPERFSEQCCPDSIHRPLYQARRGGRHNNRRKCHPTTSQPVEEFETGHAPHLHIDEQTAVRGRRVRKKGCT